jgi:hypothetical protein
LQNFPRYDAFLTGAKSTTSYTVKSKIENIENDSDIVGCYISKTAKSLQEAITQGIRITSYNSTNLTLTTSATLNSQQAISQSIFYIYKNDTSQTFWQFMGEFQPRAEIKETNPESPFYVDGTVGDIRIVLSGGDYDNIPTSELALERAKWELYTRCRLLDSLQLTCIPIYWLDVNSLISITLPTETEPKLFIVKEISISGGVTGVQTIQLMSFYNFYDTSEAPLIDNNDEYVLDNNSDAIITTVKE